MDIDVRELKRDYEGLAGKAREMYVSLKIDDEKKNFAALEAETFRDGFWSDQENSTRVNKQVSRLKQRIEPWDRLIAELDDTLGLIDIAADENDEAVLADIRSQFDGFMHRYEEIETRELLSDEDDVRNAYVTVHAGAGGTESQDWANMLLRMYIRWAEKQGFGTEIMEYSPGEEAGIKGATVLIKGEYAYGQLRSEMGVHRLVRISPFDANKRRHTSFSSIEIMPEIDDDVNIEINESDLRIDTYRSSGAGGQHVNTTDSAVRITHIPTNTVAACQNERSQHKNKATAMKMLAAKLYERDRMLKEKELEVLAGEKKDISWGNQIRSYVFQPYTMVKDHRTGEETGSVDFVMDGDINRFIYAYLKMKSRKD
jgi:peptide chain release factor 2